MAGSAVTVLDLITEVLALYGEYSPGEPIDAASSQGLLFTLNAALDGLGGEALAIYANGTLSYVTTGGKQSYTLGPDPGNDWVTVAAAPSRIPRAGVTVGGVQLPIDTTTNADEWAMLALKSLSSTFPVRVWIQYGPAAHTLNFWPVPSGSFAVTLYTAQQIPQFTSVSDSVALPAGYQEFLTYDLAIKSASKFGATVPEWVFSAWREARTRVKERNYQALESRADPALSSRTGRGWPSIKFYTGGN